MVTANGTLRHAGIDRFFRVLDNANPSSGFYDREPRCSIVGCSAKHDANDAVAVCGSRRFKKNIH